MCLNIKISQLPSRVEPYAKHIKQYIQNITVDRSTILAKIQSQDCIWYQKNTGESDSMDNKLQIEKVGSQYYIKDHLEQIKGDSLMSLLQVCQERTQIKQKDYIIIGRTQIKVCKISRSQLFVEQFLQENMFKSPIKTTDLLLYSLQNTQASEPDTLCKFCYQNQNIQNNPIICICQCIRKKQLAHLQCFQKWLLYTANYIQDISHKIYRHNTNIMCQICKQPYNLKLYLPIYKRLKQIRKYVQLQVISQRLNDRITYIIEQQGKDCISIGRNLDNLIIIEEPQISRYHCQLFYKENKEYLLIQDLNSTIGTYLKKQKYQIDQNSYKIILKKDSVIFTIQYIYQKWFNMFKKMLIN